MKKFSEFNNQDNQLVESKTKLDFIKNLVEESLTIQDGTILGKDVLVEAINSIIELNDHKTTISVLENIKAVSYGGGLNFTWLNETIELEKGKIDSAILEKAKKKDECKEECDDKKGKDKEVKDKEVEEDEEDKEVKESIEHDVFLNENFMDIVSNIGLGIGAVATTGFVGSVAWLVGSAIYDLLIKDSKLGQKGKEFAEKMKVLFSKAKKGGNDIELAKEFDATVSEYDSVINDMKVGKLGKDGQKFAKQLEKAQQAAEKNITSAPVEESLIIKRYSDDSTLELENLNSIYGSIIKENKSNK